MPHLDPIRYDLDMWLVIIPACFVVLDVLSGLVKAGKEHDIESAKMRDGLWHKGAYVIAMALAVMIEVSMQRMDLGFTVPLVAPCAGYIVLTEVASILENIARVSPELAKSPLLDLFRTANKTTNTEKEGE